MITELGTVASSANIDLKTGEVEVPAVDQAVPFEPVGAFVGYPR